MNATLASPRRTSHLLEDMTVGRVPVRVDRERRLIKGVKLLGWRSENGREYDRAAVRRALPMYEGCSCYVNHPKRASDGRCVEDKIGRFVNVRIEPSGLFGDMEYLANHPMSPRLIEAAESASWAFGFSHVATGRTVERNGTTVVVEIETVESVDLVVNPASVKGLYESKGGRRQPVPPTPEERAEMMEQARVLAVHDGKSLARYLNDDDLPRVDPAKFAAWLNDSPFVTEQEVFRGW